jgi:hypothetical protein
LCVSFPPQTPAVRIRGMRTTFVGTP